MSRPATQLNIAVHPEIGCAYIVRHIKTKKLVRVSTACQRDVDNKVVSHIRALSGDEPYFNVKIGSAYKGFKVLKFLCGAHHGKCVDKKEDYEWLGITLQQAREQGLKFDEPNYLYPEKRMAIAKSGKVPKHAGPYRSKRAIQLMKELSAELART